MFLDDSCQGLDLSFDDNTFGRVSEVIIVYDRFSLRPAPSCRDIFRSNAKYSKQDTSKVGA